MTSSGPSLSRSGSAKKAGGSTRDKAAIAGPSPPPPREAAPRALKLNKIDAVIAAVVGFFVLFFYCRADEFVWKQLYLPRDQFSKFDPAGSGLYHWLVGAPNSVLRRGDTAAGVLSLSFSSPAQDETVVSNSQLSWTIDGVVVKCGMSGRLVTSIYIDNIPVKIAGGKADEDGLGTTDTRDEGSEQLVFNVQLDRSFAMTYDLEASGLFSEGVHEVLLSVTVEIDGLAETSQGSPAPSALQQWGCGQTSCSITAARTVYFAPAVVPSHGHSLPSAAAKPVAAADTAPPGAHTKDSPAGIPKRSNIFGNKVAPLPPPPEDRVAETAAPRSIPTSPASGSSGGGSHDTAPADISAAVSAEAGSLDRLSGGIRMARHVHIHRPQNGHKIPVDTDALELKVFFSEWVIAELERTVRLQSQPDTASSREDVLRCYLSFDDDAAIDVSKMMLRGRLTGEGGRGVHTGRADRKVLAPVHSGEAVPVVISLRAVTEAGWHRIKVELVSEDISGKRDVPAFVDGWDVLKIQKL